MDEEKIELKSLGRILEDPLAVLSDISVIQCEIKLEPIDLNDSFSNADGGGFSNVDNIKYEDGNVFKEAKFETVIIKDKNVRRSGRVKKKNVKRPASDPVVKASRRLATKDPNVESSASDPAFTASYYPAVKDQNDDILNAELEKDPSGSWNCKRCCLKYKLKHLLVYHLKRSHGMKIQDFQFVCNRCSMEFATRDSLKAHIRRVHMKVKVKEEVDVSISPDLCTYEHGIWFCNKCGQNYSKKISLVNHLRKLHKTEVMGFTFQCKVCNAKCTNNNALRAHIKRHHRSRPDPERHGENRNFRLDVPEDWYVQENGMWSCLKCGYTYSKKTNMIYHLRRQHNIDTDFIYKCNLCHMEYATHEGLYRHKITRHRSESDSNQVSHQCSHCGVKFMLKRTLDDHIRLAHPEIILKRKYIDDSDDETQNDQFGVQTQNDQLDFETQNDQLDDKTQIDQIDVESRNDQLDDKTQIDQLDVGSQCDQLDVKILNDQLDVKCEDETLEIKPKIDEEPVFEVKPVVDEIKFDKDDDVKSENDFEEIIPDVVRQCNACGYILSSANNLMKHIKTVHSREYEAIILEMEQPQPDGMFNCLICNDKHSDMSVLQEHIQNDHKSTLSAVTNSSFVNLQHPLQFGLRGQSDEKEEIQLECDFCLAHFRTKEELGKHIDSIHGDGVMTRDSKEGVNSDQRTCPMCGLTLENEEVLLCHVKAKHVHTFENIKGPDAEPKPYVPTKDSVFCKLCHKRYSEMSSLRRHIKINHFNKSGDFHCKRCNTNFLSYGKLMYHTKNVHNSFDAKLKTNSIPENESFEVIFADGESQDENKTVTGFKCKTCGLILKTRQTMVQHVYLKHSNPGIKPFSCPHCEAKFKLKSYLAKHIFLKHPVADIAKKNATLVCHECGYTCTNPATFSTHCAAHRNKFKCEFCDYTTSLKTSINVHHLQHTKQKPFKCDFEGCTYEATQKTSLTVHKFRHYPEKNMRCCDICGYKTVNKYSMNHHLKEHKKGRSQYTCEFCPYTTYERANIKGHAEKHGIASSCTMCDFTTKYKQTMMRHMKSRHGINLPKRVKTKFALLNSAVSDKPS